MTSETVVWSTHSGLQLAWGAATDTGKVRQVNEDSLLAEPGVFVVADGMGGHEAGDIASQIAIQAFAERSERRPLSPSVVPEIIAEANRRVRAYAALNDRAGMGTTVVGAMLVENAGEDSLVVFNVGDSRCYVSVDRGAVVQLTLDHSLVQEMVDHGELTELEARTHPARNVVTRAIGIEDHVDADFVMAPTDDRVRLLLCSDGVSGELSTGALQHLLTSETDPRAAAQSIIDAVLQGAASDNATAIVIDAVRPTALTTEPDRNLGATGPRPDELVGATGPRPLIAPARDADATVEIATVPSTAPPMQPREIPPTDVITDVPR